MSNSAALTPTEEKELRELARKHNTWGKALRQHYWLYILLLPGVIWMIIFCR